MFTSCYPCGNKTSLVHCLVSPIVSLDITTHLMLTTLLSALLSFLLSALLLSALLLSAAPRQNPEPLCGSADHTLTLNHSFEPILNHHSALVCSPTGPCIQDYIVPTDAGKSNNTWASQNWSQLRAFPFVVIMDPTVASLTECAVIAGRKGYSNYGVEQGVDCW